MGKFFVWICFLFVCMLMFGCTHSGVQLVECDGFITRTAGSDLCVVEK